jgi:pimeloyl-ACP methyl ester carboxylesterase
VVERLQPEGVQVTAASNPLRGISIDSAYINSLLEQIPGPVLAVAHFYGGAVITNAATNANNVVGLVYVAAFAPDEGEPLAAIASKSEDSVIYPTLRPLQYPTGEDAETAVEFWIDPAEFHDVFAADLPAEQTSLMAATQRPLSELAFSEPTGVPAWKNLPSWAVVATGDKVIGTDVVRSMAERGSYDHRCRGLPRDHDVAATGRRGGDPDRASSSLPGYAPNVVEGILRSSPGFRGSYYGVLD